MEREELVAVCGLYCGACSLYRAWHDELKDRLRKALRQELAVTPEMELVKFGTLGRTEFKAKRIDDLRSSA